LPKGWKFLISLCIDACAGLRLALPGWTIGDQFLHP
jgi:hypothetical protein